ncbi:MAG: shikimate dehydrogenase [Ferruginibacter sp.]|nr:shikimate dehydrogenase [Ferruginibacter sp.]
MRLFGIIGFPLGHSFSKQYFTDKFEKEGLTDCFYNIYPIEDVASIEDIIKNNPHLKGLNVTIPHKVNVLKFLTDASNILTELKACNCIKIDGDELIGYNTDAIGFEKSLLPLLQPHHKKALVLGNGGAAQAVQYVLGKLNIEYKVVSRKLHNGSHLTYADVTTDVLAEYKLIINTTPLGTFPKVDECVDLPYHAITPQHILYDLVYNPAKTLFLQKGEEKGATIKNGYDMLILQAEENWRIWNGGQ